MKKIRQTIAYIVFLLIIITPLISVFTNIDSGDLLINKKNESNYALPKTSDIAGTDLYSEQIRAHVAGANSIIQQSLFTNDTNIFPYFDVSDPAFYKCNVLISVSNGITPAIFPKMLIESEINQYSISFNSFSGFLYYKDIDTSDVQFRAERALEIIKRKFEIDLIMVKVPEQNCYAFVGYYPNWNTYFREITSNLPMDGYWKALNVSRLASDRYTSTHFLSSTFLLINSLEFLEEDFQITTDQVNFNIEALDLSILENIGIENLFNQLTNLMEGGGGGFGNISQFLPNATETISAQDVEQISGGLSLLNLANDSHYSFLTIQYEGLNEGTKKLGDNQYQFNLWDAIGYKGEPLSPSEKIYIALIGAFMSKIDVNILCTDIVDATPEHFEFNNFLLEQLGEIFFLMGVNFDVQTLKDYSFELLWVYENGIIRNYVKPVNLNNPNDVINLLTQFGFQGIPSIPTGLLDPVEDFIVSYNTSYSEPNILITRELIGKNASYGIYRGFVFNITAKNVGNESVWGVSTSLPITLDTVFLLLAGPFYAEEFRDAMWEVIRIEYPNEYDSLEEFLNVDEDPRIFQFDSLGTGTIDYYYPDIANVSNLWPYNEKMNNVIDKLVLGYPQLMASIALLGNTPSALKEIFTNRYSIWNEDNWKLEPGETIQFNTTEIDISNLDSFSPFYNYNFTINPPSEELPNIFSGTSVGGTNSSMALSNDNQSWTIESEEKYAGRHEIEIEFFFSNQSDLDLINNTIDEVSLIINFTDQSNASSFEIFNFSMEEYQDMTPYLSSTENYSWTFSFARTNNSLDWLFNPSAPNNHTIIVKLKAIGANEFNISINDFDVEFSERDIVAYEVLASRVLFTSLSGRIQFTKSSNTITLSTYDMASVEATSFLSSYSSDEFDCGAAKCHTALSQRWVFIKKRVAGCSCWF